VNYPVAGQLKNRLAAVIYFGGGDRLAEFSFQMKFSESPFFGGDGLIWRLTGLGPRGLTSEIRKKCHRKQ